MKRLYTKIADEENDLFHSKPIHLINNILYISANDLYSIKRSEKEELINTLHLGSPPSYMHIEQLPEIYQDSMTDLNKAIFQAYTKDIQDIYTNVRNNPKNIILYACAIMDLLSIRSLRNDILMPYDIKLERTYRNEHFSFIIDHIIIYKIENAVNYCNHMLQINTPECMILSIHYIPSIIYLESILENPIIPISMITHFNGIPEYILVPVIKKYLRIGLELKKYIKYVIPSENSTWSIHYYETVDETISAIKDQCPDLGIPFEEYIQNILPIDNEEIITEFNKFFFIIKMYIYYMNIKSTLRYPRLNKKIEDEIIYECRVNQRMGIVSYMHAVNIKQMDALNTNSSRIKLLLTGGDLLQKELNARRFVSFI